MFGTGGTKFISCRHIVKSSSLLFGSETLALLSMQSQRFHHFGSTIVCGCVFNDRHNRKVNTIVRMNIPTCVTFIQFLLEILCKDLPPKVYLNFGIVEIAGSFCFSLFI